jgi:hypothetical protein
MDIVFKKKIFAFKNGKLIAVIRPANPTLALDIAYQAKENNDKAQLDSALVRCGPYKFVGYLSRKGARLLDEKGKDLGEVQPGDSFVDAESLAENQRQN